MMNDGWEGSLVVFAGGQFEVVVVVGHDAQTAYDIVMDEGAYDQLKADVAERVKG